MSNRAHELNKARILFFGTPEFAAISLHTLIEMPSVEIGLVITQPDRPAGRGGRSMSPPVKVLADQHKIPTYQPNSLKRDLAQAVTDINVHGPFDLGVVIAFGQILPQQILDLPRMGCINVHASILPRWRGAAPIQRAILAGDTETGVALMKMEAGLDTGAVFAESRLSISEQETFGSLHDRLAEAGSKLLHDQIAAIIAGTLIAQPQSDNGITYASKIKNDEARINWSNPSLEISRLIRAFNPVPGAFTTLNGKRLKIFGAIPAVQSKDVKGEPGTIHRTPDGGWLVSCGSGSLGLTEIQLEGKRRMPVVEYLRGVSGPFTATCFV